MAALRPPIEATETVTVRLTQIPPALREQIAARLIEAWERHGVNPEEWLRLRVAAINPSPDVSLEVPRWKADLVLSGRLPTGNTPKDLLW